MQSLTARGEAAGTSAATRLGRALALLGLAAVLLGLCQWRLACIRLGPDPDTDAYGHYLIARQLLATPLELRIHWVWLPLYHLLLALPVALGATLDDIRDGNALGAALPPLLLVWTLARSRVEAPATSWDAVVAAARDPVVLGAALLTGASPLLVQLGTTGQMEIVFCSLLTLAIALLAWQRPGWGALVLCALVLTRYEGWAVAATAAALVLRRRRVGGTRITRGEWAVVLAPGACVLVWAALRRLGGEPWFGFILDNQAFAERALDAAPTRRLVNAPLALLRYVALVPWRAFGLAALCALLGIGPTLRRHGVWLVAPGVAIIAFLTLSSLTRSQLGLDRHFASVVPFAATWIAYGLARIVASVGSALERALDAPFGRRLGWLGAIPFLLSAAAHLSDGLATWLDFTRDALREPREVAGFLRATPADASIVCHEAAIEVLSELEPERFSRRALDERNSAGHGLDGELYVVQRARERQGSQRGGDVVYGSVDGPPDAFVVTRFAADDAPVQSAATRHGR